jgi:hypothetical protein
MRQAAASISLFPTLTDKSMARSVIQSEDNTGLCSRILHRAKKILHCNIFTIDKTCINLQITYSSSIVDIAMQHFCVFKGEMVNLFNRFWPNNSSSSYWLWHPITQKHNI